MSAYEEGWYRDKVREQAAEIERLQTDLAAGTARAQTLFADLTQAQREIERLKALWDSRGDQPHAEQPGQSDVSDCPHEFHEREASVATEGLCPLCMRAKIVELERLLDAAPILSKYHGSHGFEVERFVRDYTDWWRRS